MSAVAIDTRPTPLLYRPTESLEQASHFEFGVDNRMYSKNSPINYHQQNVEIRMKMVAVLGGEAAVKAIRSIPYPIRVTEDYLAQIRSGEYQTRFRQEHRLLDSEPVPIEVPASAYMDELENVEFLPGEAIVQTEDPAGRKAIVIRIADKSQPNVIKVDRIFQRRHEYYVHPWHNQDGSTWISHYLIPYSEANFTLQDSNKLADQLALLVEGNHPKYMLVKA